MLPSSVPTSAPAQCSAKQLAVAVRVACRRPAGNNNEHLSLSQLCRGTECWDFGMLGGCTGAMEKVGIFSFFH